MRQTPSPVQLESRSNASVTLLQLTDTHLFVDSAGEFGDIVSERSLHAVLQSARDAAHWPPDALLLTGDLAQQPVAETYQKLQRIFSDCELPVFCLPGNHDAPELMQQYLNSGNTSTHKQILIGPWCILLLNSFKPDTHAGELSAPELDWLADQLSAHQDKHIFIALHHHPISIHSPWMDSMMLENAEEFLTLLKQQPKVRAVLFGHIHQAFHEQHFAIEFIGSPSTCAQFKPAASAYARDNKTAGYRCIQLANDGGIRTSIHRLHSS